MLENDGGSGLNLRDLKLEDVAGYLKCDPDRLRTLATKSPSWKPSTAGRTTDTKPIK
jgi:hypothetical protein